MYTIESKKDRNLETNLVVDFPDNNLNTKLSIVFPLEFVRVQEIH